jgi:hypothetical protein
MKYDEFKQLLKNAKVSIKALAYMLEMHTTPITNYKAQSKVPRHLAVVALLLAGLAAHNIPPGPVLHR